MKKSLIILIIITLTCCKSTTPDIVIADFEGTDYEDWLIEGVAFGDRPTTIDPDARAFAANRAGIMGRGFVRSAPRSTGTLTSPKFKVERDYMVLLLGGRNMPDVLSVNIIQDGKILHTLTGDNDRLPKWRSLDLKELVGEEIQIQIVDQSEEAIITVDHICLSDYNVGEKSKEYTIQKQFINLPVRTGLPRTLMLVEIDGDFFTEFIIELAESDPEYYVFIDVEKFKGSTANITARTTRGTSKAFDYISVDDEIKDAHDLYHERLRQQIHFSSRRGWLNDPNGLVYYDGEYHLFYQHNPYGWGHSNMHWGHAVSRDLVHWEELPIALRPVAFGDWAFSGGGVIDFDNTAGFKTGDEDVIILSWTSTARGECISYSNDRGRTFQEYEGNPVVEHNGRDPKVFWYEPGNHWVMAVFNQEPEFGRNLAFYTSNNLKDWTFQSRNLEFYECPEVFKLAVDGDPDNSKWIYYEADGSYAIGDFDGKVFTEESKHSFHHGNAFYASQTFSNIPEEDGRIIQIGWARGVDTPGMPFNQSMLFPTVLTLRTTVEGLRLHAEPVKEIELLHKNKHVFKDRLIVTENTNIEKISGELFHIIGSFDVSDNSVFGFNIHGTEIIYNGDKQLLSCIGLTAPLIPENNTIRLELIVDRNSIEIFGNNGRVYMPLSRELTEKDEYSVMLINIEGVLNVNNLEINELESIWK